MTNPSIRDLADKCITAALYAELCRECGSDAITEENTIVSAVPVLARVKLSTGDERDYWLWLADQTCTAQEEHDSVYGAPSRPRASRSGG